MNTRSSQNMIKECIKLKTNYVALSLYAMNYFHLFPPKNLINYIELEKRVPPIKNKIPEQGTRGSLKNLVGDNITRYGLTLEIV